MKPTAAMVCGLLPALFWACTADAFVYLALPDAASMPEDRDVPEPIPAGMSGGGADVAGAVSVAEGEGGADASAAIDGCDIDGIDPMKVVSAFIMRGGAGDWLHTNQVCASNYECVQTLVAPVCDKKARRCTACGTDIAATSLLYINVGRCLIEARARCCSDPNAARDCLFSNCLFGCGSSGQ